METLNFPLNEQQLHFLRMFSKELPKEDFDFMRKIASEYFANKLMDEMDKVWDEKNWTNETMDKFKNEHFRLPYKENQ